MVAPVMLTADEVAERVSKREDTQITGASWRRYVYGGKAPKPDTRVGRTPLWRASTVDRWVKGEDPSYPRLGRGVTGGRPPKARVTEGGASEAVPGQMDLVPA